MSEDSAFNALQEKAEAAASDIAGDLKANCMPSDDPSYEPDVGYNLYVQKLDGQTLGVIDMGDLYHEVFQWVDGEWHHAPYNSHEIENRIIAHRESWRRAGRW